MRQYKFVYHVNLDIYLNDLFANTGLGYLAHLIGYQGPVPYFSKIWRVQHVFLYSIILLIFGYDTKGKVDLYTYMKDLS